MKTTNGFIVLHRKMLEWEWYDEPNVFRLFMHCLLRASHKQKKYRGMELIPGQFTTSLGVLSQETGLSVQQIRTAFNKLKSTGEVTSEGNSKCTVVTVNNWNKYQEYNKPDNNQITNEQQSSNNHSTTINNDNNVNNDNKEPPPQWVDVIAWNEFVQHRKDIRKPLTPLAKTKNLKVLEQHQDKQREIIDKTIANRWTGLFPPDNKGVTNGQNKQDNRSRAQRVSDELDRLAQAAIDRGETI